MRRPNTIAEAFVNAVAAFPDNEAVVGADGSRFSYTELGAEVARMVAVLRSLDCGKGDRVAIWLANRPEWTFLQYACALLGVVIIPINARNRAAEAEYVLAQSRAKVLFTQGHFLTNNYLARLQEIADGPLGTGERAGIAKLPVLERVVVLDGDAPPGTMAFDRLDTSGAAAVDMAAMAAQRRPDDHLWIFFTSGTTNRPKGAILQHNAIVNIWDWTHLVRMRVDDRILTSFPVYYVAGNYWCLLAAMVHGAAVIMSGELTADETVRLCREEKVTVLSGIPFLLKDIIHDPAFDASAFETVRMGFIGGAVFPADDTREIVERIGYDYLIQVYGMTETHGVTMSTAPDDPFDIMVSTCGRPLPSFEIRLIDPETGQDVPDGEPGALITRGCRLVDYEGMSEEDRTQFFDDQGYYHTGDVLRKRPDGRYEFVTRARDLIKVGGENATAAEIERVLKEHPKAFTVQVIGVPDAQRGEVPAAFFELQPGESLELDELRDWCRSRMAPFKAPRHLRIVPPGGWPRTATDKIARFRLNEML